MPTASLPVQPEEIESERGITEITCHPRVTQVSVELTHGASELCEILRALEASGLDVSLVKIHSGALNFVADGDLDPSRVARIVKRPVKIISNCATVMLLSPAMRMMHGIMASAVRALYAKDIEVHATSDTYDRLALVIDGKHLKTALSLLAKQFGVEKRKT